MKKRLPDKLLQWLKSKPPTLSPEGVKAIVGDLRKVGLAAMGAGLVALFNPTGQFTVLGVMFLFFIGMTVWVCSVVLYSFTHKGEPPKE